VDLALRAWPVIPVLCLTWPSLHGVLLRYADAVLGFDATLCLVATLLITPVITTAKLPIARLRFWYGMWVFVLGSAGLAIHLAYPPGSLAWRAAHDSVNWTGTVIVVLLLPMAATSSAAAQRLLGPEWKRWQRNLIWAVWACVGIHFALMSAWLVLGAYLAASAPCLVLRWPSVRKAVKEWRAGGYSTGGLWAAMAVLVPVTVTGFVLLLTEEVMAVARALALAGYH
jgi:DMSO/TMAO reductase YedYZ heme-binding membrane subunit